MLAHRLIFPQHLCVWKVEFLLPWKTLFNIYFKFNTVFCTKIQNMSTQFMQLRIISKQVYDTVLERILQTYNHKMSAYLQAMPFLFIFFFRL
jgi:hypothetical protein